MAVNNSTQITKNELGEFSVISNQFGKININKIELNENEVIMIS